MSFIFNLSSYILCLDSHSGEGLWVAYTVPSVCAQFSCHHHGEERVGWSSKDVQVDLKVGLQNVFISELTIFMFGLVSLQF